jgi:hypothetical protein
MATDKNFTIKNGLTVGSTEIIDSSGNVDGRDVSADGTKLDGIAINATNVSALTDLSISDGTNGQVLTTDGSGSFTFSDAPSGDLVDDTTPQLGGDFDLNSSNITGTGNIDITGQVTLGGSSPEIKFNNSTDGGIEIAMRLNASEGLEFYEPEDSDKVQFTIKDDSGVDATYGYAVNGTNVIDSSRNIQNIGNITLTGTVDGRDVATDGTKLDGVAVNATNVSALTDLSISDGTNGQVLTTDGSGSFTFEDGGTNSTLTTYNFTATSNQTTFSGADSNSNTLSYAGPNLIVSVNGVVHRNGVEYTATNGTSVVFSSGLETSDEVSIVTFSVIDLTNIDYSNVNNTPSLATVATSGSYSDLSGTPSLATVATSGSYTDLSNTPLAYNSVGSYLLGYVNGPSTSGPSDLLPGQQLAGSYIRPAGIRLNSDSTTEFNANDEAAGGINAVTYRGDYVPSGTWRVMGNLDRGDNSTANYGRFTLFVRIS